MASILPVLLLGLFLQCTPSYSKHPCMLENAVGEGNFNVTVSPHYYKPNTTYNVTTSGMGSKVAVTLTAYMNGSSIGTWENENENVTNCAGVTREGSLPITERWTSPNDIASYVNFRACIMMGNATYCHNKTIKKASDDMNTSTAMTTHVYTNMTTMKMQALLQ
ncbi:placenta-expressed transcript 1 protein-like [Pristis pectinata]|uniref:placenta-expressed transcript 1 protein-like n=1 Tax=Pristis pectinata TaxID=685728 RepID=UPI00223DCFA0|nr:placenta-expressed transcript 1 protein-like [Pristis pectinata]